MTTVTSSWYQVPSTGLSKEQHTKALTETARAAQLSVQDTLGFQANFREFAHAECAQGFLSTHLNNGGELFGPSWLVDFFSAKGHPILVIFNYGTTFKGAYDDVQSAGEALIPILKKNGMYE